MPPTSLHENPIQALAERIQQPLSTLRAQKPEVLDHYLRLHCNKASFYELALDGRSEFQPDLGIYYDNDGLFFLEVAVFQIWDDLVRKVEAMVQGSACWGVLVMRIVEADKWSEPKRRPAAADFVAKADWLARAKASRVDNPFGPVSIGGRDWTKGALVEVYWFNHGWKNEDGLPKMVRYSFRLLQITLIHASSIVWSQAGTSTSMT